MPTYQTPGVYFERADASVGGVAPLRTDVAGFVGIAQRGPVGIALPVESYKQFLAWYGDVFDNGYLAYCARAFFENGGRRMWVVRVAAAADAASLTLNDAAGPAWRIEASTPGVFGNGVAVRVSEVRRVAVRALVDAVDPQAIRTPSVAGFGAGTLVELRAGTVRERALVVDVDALRRIVRLDRPLALFALSAEVTAETVAYSIEVFADGRRVALYEDLALAASHPRYGPRVLRLPWQPANSIRPEEPPTMRAEFAAADQFFRTPGNRGAATAPAIVIRELRDASARAALNLLVGAGGAAAATSMLLTGGADGLAALAVRDFTGEVTAPEASDDAWADGHRGLATLAAVDEVALLAVPDILIRPSPAAEYAPPPSCAVDRCLPTGPTPATTPPRPLGDVPPRFSAADVYQVQAAMIDQCERRRDRMALIEPMFEAVSRLSFVASELREWRQRFDSAFAAFYAPWLLVVDPLRAQARRPGGTLGLTRAIPPSGHVAGVFAATDLRAGVHVAPANAALEWVQDVSLPIDDTLHALLNELGINAIRAQAGRGLRILGARTLSSDTDWRFVPVRRLVAMIEKAIDLSIQWATFEPNDWRTRAKLVLVIGSFLREWWARGAFVGATPDAAFFVRCDETNNPADTRDLGMLVIDVGIAPAVPFEFIVLRIGRDANGFAVREDDLAVAA